MTFAEVMEKARKGEWVTICEGNYLVPLDVDVVDENDRS